MIDHLPRQRYLASRQGMIAQWFAAHREQILMAVAFMAWLSTGIKW